MIPPSPAALLLTTPSLYWSNLALSVGKTILWDQSMSHHYIRATSKKSLNGFAYNCNDMVIGFTHDKLYCQLATGGQTFECGTYSHCSKNKLTGITTSGPFRATHVQVMNDLLISFVAHDVTCNLVSLDFRTYSHDEYLGLTCPSNHYSFGKSGDVALRSRNDKGVIVWDSYGVYQWNHDGTIQMYFGPQETTTITILEGTLDNETMQLHVHDSEPCIHDGSSPITSLNGFPRVSLPAVSSHATGRYNVFGYNMLVVVCSFVLSTWVVLC